MTTYGRNKRALERQIADAEKARTAAVRAKGDSAGYEGSHFEGIISDCDETLRMLKGFLARGEFDQ